MELSFGGFVGISFHGTEPEVIQAAIDSKFQVFNLTAYSFGEKHYAQVRVTIARAAQAGLGIVAMKVMGGTKTLNASRALKWVLQDANVHTISQDSQRLMR